MRHAGTQELETDRLLLRRLLPEDADMMYQNWASDPDVTRFLRWEPHRNELETLALLAAWATLYPNPDYYQWAGIRFHQPVQLSAGRAPAEERMARAGHFRGRLGSGLLHRETLVEPGLHHRSAKSSSRILV